VAAGITLEGQRRSELHFARVRQLHVAAAVRPRRLVRAVGDDARRRVVELGGQSRSAQTHVLDRRRQRDDEPRRVVDQ